MTRSYDPRNEGRGLENELQRLRTQTLLSWSREIRLLRMLGLQDGDTLLELGSGPGFVTEQLLMCLPRSTITALDHDPELIEWARVYLGAAVGDRVHLVQASASDTGLPESHFDFVIARYLFQHLVDPIQTAREMRRVLKPGGKLAIIDIDAALWGIVEPIFPEVASIYAKTGQFQAQHGGNRLIGRQLWRMLKAAGYQQIELEAFVYHSDALGVAPFAPQIAPDRLLPLLERGAISLREYQQAHMAYTRFLAAPDAYVLMAGLIACGETPTRDAHSEM
jgi:ubiquinone/menaquinone biosynthesis C-methylase UbiE